MFVNWVKTYRLIDIKGQALDIFSESLKEDEKADQNSSFEPAEFRRVVEAYLFMQSLFDRSSEAWGLGLSIW
jgi:hypothetical protein